MIIQRRLKYIEFFWDDDTKELIITTYSKTNDMATGTIILGKVYLFSTMRFMLRISQRMWLRRKK